MSLLLHSSNIISVSLLTFSLFQLIIIQLSQVKIITEIIVDFTYNLFNNNAKREVHLISTPRTVKGFKETQSLFMKLNFSKSC